MLMSVFVKLFYDIAIRFQNIRARQHTCHNRKQTSLRQAEYEIIKLETIKVSMGSYALKATYAFKTTYKGRLSLDLFTLKYFLHNIQGLKS